jgi:hypothetical protein
MREARLRRSFGGLAFGASRQSVAVACQPRPRRLVFATPCYR